MGGGWEYLLPIKAQTGCPVRVPFISGNYSPKKSSPFFHFSNEDNTVKLFLDSLAKSSLEDASVYVSKVFFNFIDLKEVQSFLQTKGDYKYLIKAGIGENKGNCKTNSVLIINEENRNNIIHLHLIKEPDRFSCWKIYGIEKE